ncbi:MAG: type II toxin-antitoxin system HicB family antitoxin [Spirochaetota bacterium]
MKDVLTYKEFIGSVHFSAEDEVFYGKLEGIDDLATFEAKDVVGLKKAFEKTVDDYIELCSQSGKNAEKSYKGSFNVRISPELHRIARRRATQLGISLNQLVLAALEHEINSGSAQGSSPAAAPKN